MAHANTENSIPQMTSNTTPSGRVSASSEYNATYPAWKAFNRTNNDVNDCWASTTTNAWIQYEFSEPKMIGKYSITNRNAGNVNYIETPKDWTFEGSNDGVNWNVLDNVSNNPSWTSVQTKEYNIDNRIAFKYYRLHVSSVHSGAIVTIGKIEMFVIIYDDKSLIHHNSTYKHYTNNQWDSLPSPPTEQDYLDYGMDDLSIIPESAWQELEGEVELCYYTDNPNKSEASFNITTSPFTLAEEWEDKEIKIIEYTDDPNQTESSITLETEPFTIYDELGDNIDVLYYTDDPDKTEAKLNITANYSPLDELEGDFDVVTYSEDVGDGEKLSLTVNALPKGQLVIDPNSFAYLGDIKSFVSSLEGNKSGEIIRYLISFDDGMKWESYSQGLKDWRTISTSNINEIKQYGMRDEVFNNIPADKITKKQNGNIKLGYYIEESHHIKQSVALDYISYSSMVPKEDVKFSDIAFNVLNTAASIKLQFAGNKLTGTLYDEDLTKVQYRVILNGNPYYPRDGEFTRLSPPPVNISLNISERDIAFGQENILKVEFQDAWGQTDFWEATFVGTYSGIMFKDEEGKFLSNSFGEVLKYLEFGDIIAGQTTLEQKVIVKNQMGVQTQNLILNVMKDKLPEGVQIELSRTNNPFVAEEPLLFNMFFNPDEEFEFYVRITTDIEAPANPSGEFEVRANANPV